MQLAPIPANEQERLAALRKLKILDTPPEEQYDRITRIAAHLFGVPISTVTLVDSNKEWFKSCFGLDNGEGDRAISFCGHAMLADGVFIIPDATKDPRFADNPMVVGEPYIRFYAGVALSSADGYRIGTFCIKDRKPRNLTGEEVVDLKALAAWAELEINSHDLSHAMETLKASQKKLEEINAKDEAFLKSIGEGLIVVNQEGKVILANKVALELSGFPQNQLLGKVWAKDLPAVEDEQSRKILYEKLPVYDALHNQERKTVKVWYRFDGMRIPVIVTAAPVVIDGKNQGAVVVFRDITKEEEIDKAKSEFISLASHQLRTPLAAIKWFIELLFDTKELTEEQKDFIGNISRSTERMIELVNALLNISRIESGRITINPQQTSLEVLIKDIISSLEKDITNKKQQLKIEVEPDLPEISIDQKMIRIVYENLLTNAIKYTPSGGEISVSVYKKDNDVVSEIADSGLGIPEKDYSRVFDKFYRGENVVKVEPDGTGLGLYLAKAVVTSSGGKIWFESTEGKGTTFFFSLPLTGTVAKKGEVILS